MLYTLKVALGFLTIFARSPSRASEELSQLGRNFWWSAPLIELISTAVTVTVCLLAGMRLNSPVTAATLFIGLDHLVHGFRRVDGFGDLAEAMFYRLSNPRKQIIDVWQVVRAPQNGPYGTAIIFCYLLLEWSLVTRSLESGSRRFVLAVTFSALLSKLALAVAVATPARFRRRSDFVCFAMEVAQPVKLLLLTLVVVSFCIGIGWAIGCRSRTDALAIFIVLAVALAIGLVSRMLVLRCLGRLNGDLLGFSWVLAELGVLLTLNLL